MHYEGDNGYASKDFGMELGLFMAGDSMVGFLVGDWVWGKGLIVFEGIRFWSVGLGRRLGSMMSGLMVMFSTR